MLKSTKKISILFMFVLLTSCGVDFEVEEHYKCTEKKVQYVCKADLDTLAYCNEAKECEKICNDHRRKYNDGDNY